MKSKELRGMNEQELATKVAELKGELFKLRLSGATSPSRSFSSTKNVLKRDIARTLTILRQKSLGIE